LNKVHVFFDDDTNTLSYVLSDMDTQDAVVIDPLLNFDPASVQTSTSGIDAILEYVKYNSLKIRMILETHPHADHLSGAQVLKELFPDVPLAIGAGICEVQRLFQKTLNLGSDFPLNGSQFDRLLHHGEKVQAGSLTFEVIATPGHTPACSSYRFGNEVFVGDTIFMPDYGTGRCDFPGGNARTLFRSVTERLYTLPDSTLLYSGHDYLPGGRPLRWEAMVGEQKRANIHLRADTQEDDFVKFRADRDATLSAPRLLFPSIQVNLDAGRLPQPASNGISYLRLPLNTMQRRG
jgi:glyoxylase-like metal-dependent hydrolase (beta-lactamase superfamily II)